MERIRPATSFLPKYYSTAAKEVSLSYSSVFFFSIFGALIDHNFDGFLRLNTNEDDYII